MLIVKPTTVIDDIFNGTIILNYNGVNYDLANTICYKTCRVKIKIREWVNKVHNNSNNYPKDIQCNISFKDYFDSEIELQLIEKSLITGNPSINIGECSVKKIYFDNNHLIISGSYTLTDPYSLAFHINDMFDFIILIENNQFHSAFIKRFKYHIEKLGLIE